MRTTAIRNTLALLTIFAAVTASGAAPSAAPWPNGDFELGAASWTAASTTTIGDADGDGDQEARFAGCGDGTWQLSRGISKGVVPASTPWSFTVESGQVDAWDFRMILVDASEPMPYLNNLDPLAPNWVDDHVLIWYSWSNPLAGDVVLDPLAAHAANIPGWDAMDADARAARLATMVHATIVMYGCTAGGATLDDFAWVTG